jgi:predicted exporter
MEVTRSAAFVTSLDRILSQGEVGKIGAFALGGPHFVVSSASVMARDIRLAFALTAVLVAAVFFWFFRQVRTLPVALLPGGVGILVAAAVMGFAGVRIHALTLGFAATITGISVDYVIHLLHRAGAIPEGSTGERMSAALDGVARPVILGCLTTVGSFALIAMSGFTGIRQMALFSIISLPTALAVTLFLVPPFHAFALGRGRGGARLPALSSPFPTNNRWPGARL